MSAFAIDEVGMRIDEFVSLCAQHDHHTNCHLLIPYLGHRLKNEGLECIISGMCRAYDHTLRSLANDGCVPDHIEFLPSWYRFEGNPGRLLNFLGLLSRISFTGRESGEADWSSFINRSREASNFAGCGYEDIIPLPPGYTRWVRRLLGRAPSVLFCKHGPGATAEKLFGLDKWLVVADTPSLSDRAPFIRCTSVPKDWKKRRIIGIEPAVNQFFQQGAASALRKTRFFKTKANLEDLAGHLSLACDEDFTTIDLSDASDRVVMSLVEYLLPPDWYDLLVRLTTGMCVLPDGTTHSLGMFATMGSGFCFEVETLVFYLVSVLVIRNNRLAPLPWGADRLSVYGDDIVLPKDYLPAFEHVAQQLGWSISEKKTCRTPFFKETVGFWIVNGVSQRRFLPKLTLDGSELFFEGTREVLDLCDRLLSLGLDSVAGRLFDDYDFPTRWNSSLHRLEIRASSSATVTRRCNVTDDNLYRYYWLSRVRTSPTEDTPFKCVSTHWIPMDSYEYLGDLLRTRE